MLLTSASYTKNRINVSEKHKSDTCTQTTHHHPTSCITTGSKCWHISLTPTAAFSPFPRTRRCRTPRGAGLAAQHCTATHTALTAGTMLISKDHGLFRVTRAGAQLGLLPIWQISLFNLTLIVRCVKSLILLADTDCICLTSEAWWLTVLMYFLIDEKGNDSFWLTFKHISSLQNTLQLNLLFMQPKKSILYSVANNWWHAEENCSSIGTLTVGATWLPEGKMFSSFL